MNATIAVKTSGEGASYTAEVESRTRTIMYTLHRGSPNNEAYTSKSNRFLDSAREVECARTQGNEWMCAKYMVGFTRLRFVLHRSQPPFTRFITCLIQESNGLM
jgi:hypothetical protein